MFSIKDAFAFIFTFLFCDNSLSKQPIILIHFAHLSLPFCLPELKAKDKDSFWSSS